MGPATETCNKFINQFIKVYSPPPRANLSAMGAAEPLLPSRHLVALLSGSVVAVRVWEVDVAGRDLHHLLDVAAAFADHVRVLRVGHVHLQSHLVHLDFTFKFIGITVLVSSVFNKGRKRSYNNNVCKELKSTLVSSTSKIIFLASDTLTRFPSTFTCGSRWTELYSFTVLLKVAAQSAGAEQLAWKMRSKANSEAF